MSAELKRLVKKPRPLFWALLFALFLHLLLLIVTVPSKEISLEQRFSEATEVILYDQETVVQEVEASQVLPTEETTPPPNEAELASSQEAEQVVEEKLTSELAEPLPPEKTPPSPRLSKNLIARSLEIARLEAELAAMQTSYAQQTRVRRISSGAKMTSEEALYLKQWEQKVERIGNLNYPEEARKQNLGGRLRLMVVIAADGRILEAQLLTSSGHSLLDDAAVRILNLAAPFAPLPESIKANADVLEIIRTWQFGDGWYAN